MDIECDRNKCKKKVIFSNEKIKHLTTKKALEELKAKGWIVKDGGNYCSVDCYTKDQSLDKDEILFEFFVDVGDLCKVARSLNVSTAWIKANLKNIKKEIKQKQKCNLIESIVSVSCKKGREKKLYRCKKCRLAFMEEPAFIKEWPEFNFCCGAFEAEG